MAKDYYKRIFPLYLSALERFMLTDDREDYPMCFIIETDFTGQLLREPFEEAVRQSLDRHRILQCVVSRAKKGRLCWVHDPEQYPFLSWDQEGVPLDTPDGGPQGDYIDLTKEIGLRIWVRQGPEKVRISYYFHHSSADGIAAHRFMADVLAIYTNEVCAEQPAKLQKLQPDLMVSRGRRQQLAGQSVDHPHTSSYAFKYLLRMSILGSDSVRTPPRRYSKKLLSPRFGVAVHRFSKDEYKALRDAAVNLGVTGNDLLLAQMFMTFFEWNRRHRKLGRKREIRILMPLDMRSRKDDAMPAVNMASYNFITRKPKHLKDPVDFVQGIRKETQDIKQKGMGSAFIDAITRATFVPGMLRLSLPGFRCTASVVLSNVGDPTRRWTCSLPRKRGQVIAGNGDLLLNDLTGVPPLRPLTNVSMAITTYMRQLSVSMRCNPHFFKLEDTQEVLDHFCDGLHQWIRKGEERASNS